MPFIGLFNLSSDSLALAICFRATVKLLIRDYYVLSTQRTDLVGWV